MTVLKAIDFQQTTQPQRCFNLTDIADEARRLMADAEAQAQQRRAEIEAQAHADAERIKTQAQQEGYQAGSEEGRQTAYDQALAEYRETFAAESKETLDYLRAICEEFSRIKHDTLWRAEQGTVALAIAIAEKVVKLTGLAVPSVTAANVKAALELISHSTDLVIHVNPRDVEHLERLAATHEELLGKHDTIRIEPDPALEPGGCRINTDHGVIDAQLDTQVRRIAEELMMTINNGPMTPPAAPPQEQEENPDES